jgi:hypothetical protein
MPIRSKLFLLLFAASIYFAGCSLIGGSTSQELTLTEIDPTFAPLASVITVPKVTYPSIGEDVYDVFFKEVGKLDGIVQVGNAVLDLSMSSMQTTVKNVAANESMKADYANIAGDTPVDKLTDDQLASIIKVGVKKHAVSSDVIKGYSAQGDQMLMVSSALKKGVQKIPGMITYGSGLAKNTSSLPPMKIASASSAALSAVSNLNSIQDNSTALLGRLTKLAGLIQKLGKK